MSHATLGGHVDNPEEWWLPYVDDELKEYELNMHLAADAVLLGRVTYEAMAQAWPNMGDHPFAGAFVGHVNSITYYVVTSNTIDTTKWNPTVVIAGADLINEIPRMKQAGGGNILIWGTGQLTDALAAAGLLDEFRISWAPIITGGGQPLFFGPPAPALSNYSTQEYLPPAQSFTPTAPPQLHPRHAMTMKSCPESK